jgi:hypothetical protein
MRSSDDCGPDVGGAREGSFGSSVTACGHSVLAWMLACPVPPLVMGKCDLRGELQNIRCAFGQDGGAGNDVPSDLLELLHRQLPGLSRIASDTASLPMS